MGGETCIWNEFSPFFYNDFFFDVNIFVEMNVWKRVHLKIVGIFMYVFED
jgi:hypothetical protein